MTSKASTSFQSEPGKAGIEPGREIILDAAARLFSERGFEATSINDLARAVGRSKSTIYHYFTDKNQIYIDVILWTLTALCEQVEQAVAAQSTARTRFLAYAESHALFFQEHMAAYTAATIGFGGIAQPLQREQVVQLRDRHEGQLRRIVEDGVRTGEFHDADPRLVARALLSCLNWMVRWYRRDGQDSATEIARSYANLLLTGIVRQ